MKKPKSGGGWRAIRYTWAKAREAGGVRRLWRAMRTRNACKTCALGMGGQRGGMVNEAGRFPEVCKKSLQAMVADMQGAIRDDFWSTYSVAQLQAFTPRQLETCGRLVTPVLYTRGEQFYRTIGWDEALDRIAGRLRSLPPDDTFWYFSGRSSNEAAFLLALLARVYGTNNVNNCSYYCHQASGVGLTSMIGSGAGTITLEDLDHTDLVFVIGGNPASNHPRLMRTLMEVRRRGGEVIVVNPVVETGLVNFRVPSDVRSLIFGSRIASLYVQPDIGGDLALFSGVAKRVIELGATDAAFVDEHCSGGEQLQRRLAELPWEEIERKSGVSRALIDDIAGRYARSRRAVFAWTMGVTHHAHGVQNVQAIANLALLRGMVGRPHCGLLPIRGHSNVQGIGTVGVTPVLKEALYERLQTVFGVRLPTAPGLDTYACLEAAAAGRLRAGICLGGNLYGSNPDLRFAAEALSQLDLLISLNTTLNTGHAHALAAETLILPVLARDEEPQPTTQESMFSFVRLSDGGPRRLDGPRSEVQAIAALGRRLFAANHPVDWNGLEDHGQIRRAIAQVVPGLEALAEIERTKQEFAIPGRAYHAPRFATTDRKARLFSHDLPELLSAPDHLRLMTVRSEGQFNTVVYEEEDIYRGQERRDVILIHPDDIARLGLRADTRASVHSEVGAMTGILVRSYPEIKQGNALMYFPEANVLVPRRLDPQSKTPAFNGVLVQVSPEGA